MPVLNKLREPTQFSSMSQTMKQHEATRGAVVSQHDKTRGVIKAEHEETRGGLAVLQQAVQQGQEKLQQGQETLQQGNQQGFSALQHGNVMMLEMILKAQQMDQEQGKLLEFTCGRLLTFSILAI